VSGSTIYGAAGSGKFGGGTIFAINTDGTGFTNIYNFTAAPAPYGTNSGGAGPGFLILSGSTLYGIAGGGGPSGQGTVFAVNTNGTGFKMLYSFPSDILDSNTNSLAYQQYTNGAGAKPMTLVVSGNALYGTTREGGSTGFDTIFSLSFRPQLTIAPSGANFVLMWPANFAGFDYSGYTLQSTTDLGPAAIWTTNLPAPTIINGQFTVTNPISGAQQFYRLTQ
jgi:uncharacterized repeat protein (TIGR03803 family)